jgi:hypothetical protein
MLAASATPAACAVCPLQTADGYAEAGKDMLGVSFHSGFDAHVDGGVLTMTLK